MKPKKGQLGLFFFGSVFGLLLLLACKKSTPEYYHLPAYSINGSLQCVIEIPAGTNKKIEFNPDTGTFEVDQRDGEDRIINFLGYPGNYGFIPSTYSNPETGGDGDALDIIVLSESVPTGTVMEVIPLGMLQLIDNGESDDKIIAIPLGNYNQTIQASNLMELQAKYPQALKIVESWFKNYDTQDVVLSNGWANEVQAKKLIDSLRIK